MEPPVESQKPTDTFQPESWTKLKFIKAQNCALLAWSMAPKASVVVVVLESPRNYLTIQEAASYMRVSVRTVSTLIKSRQLTYSKVRGQLRFRLSWCNEYLDKRTVKAA